MTFRSTTAAIVVLATATVWAQNTSPVTQSSAPVSAPAGNPFISQRHSLAGRRGMAGNKTTGVPTPATLRQRLQDMEGTLAKMHLLLKQMRANAVKSGAKDPLAKANIDMWELMVGHLDKQFEELGAATLAREDLEARRAAMYKQADAKAAAAAAAASHAGAQASGAPQAPPAGATGPDTEAGKPGQAAAGATAGQTPPQPSAPDSESPK